MKECRKVKKLHFVEHSVGASYNNELETPLKEGDLILLTSKWDKNDKSRFWKISGSVDNSRNPINWDEKMVFAYKLGVRKTASNGKLIHFDAINWVIDGNSTEAINFENDILRQPRNVEENGLDSNLITNLVSTESRYFSHRDFIEPKMDDPFFDQQRFPAERVMQNSVPSYSDQIRSWDNSKPRIYQTRMTTPMY